MFVTSKRRWPRALVIHRLKFNHILVLLIEERIERHKMKLAVTDYNELLFGLSFGNGLQQ